MVFLHCFPFGIRFDLGLKTCYLLFLLTALLLDLYFVYIISLINIIYLVIFYGILL